MDPSIASSNLGDEIISEAVETELRKLFPNSHFTKGFTQEPFGDLIRQLHSISYHTFVGGTNLLSSEMNNYSQWKIKNAKNKYLPGVILFGVGWWQYQNKPNKYTATLLKKALSDKFFHSVRDSYTEQKLKSIGIQNVINTACPTMWELDELHCQQIPVGISSSVIFTITDYNQNPVNDRAMIDTLIHNYRKVFFWPQGKGDLDYLTRVMPKLDELIILPPSLGAYRKLLADCTIKLDYVGTRLHAGIFALKHKRRSLIIAIDNRAEEIGRDYNIPLVTREAMESLESKITVPAVIDIQLPHDNIKLWKEQFV